MREYPMFDKDVIKYVKKQGFSVSRQPSIGTLFGTTTKPTNDNVPVVKIVEYKLEINGREHEVDFSAEEGDENINIVSWQSVRGG